MILSSDKILREILSEALEIIKDLNVVREQELISRTLVF